MTLPPVERLDPAAQGQGARGVRRLAGDAHGPDRRCSSTRTPSRSPRACWPRARSAWPGCFAVIYDVDRRRGRVPRTSSRSQALRLVMNRAKNYGAIWKDPAGPDVHASCRGSRPEAVRVPPSAGQPLADAVAGLTEPLAQEGALADALLHALERYQGAQAAGDERVGADPGPRRTRPRRRPPGPPRPPTPPSRTCAPPWPPTSTASSGRGRRGRRDRQPHPHRRASSGEERRSPANRGFCRRRHRGLEADYVARGRAAARQRQPAPRPTSTRCSPRSTGMRDRPRRDHGRLGRPRRPPSRRGRTSTSPRPNAGGPYTHRARRLGHPGPPRASTVPAGQHPVVRLGPRRRRRVRRRHRRSRRP